MIHLKYFSHDGIVWEVVKRIEIVRKKKTFILEVREVGKRKLV